MVNCDSSMCEKDWRCRKCGMREPTRAIPPRIAAPVLFAHAQTLPAYIRPWCLSPYYDTTDVSCSCVAQVSGHRKWDFYGGYNLARSIRTGTVACVERKLRAQSCLPMAAPVHFAPVCMHCFAWVCWWFLCCLNGCGGPCCALPSFVHVQCIYNTVKERKEATDAGSVAAGNCSRP